MYCVRKMTEDLYWVGASERRLNLFENAYPLTNGVLELPSVYTDGDAITVEPIFTKGALATIAKPLTWLWWVIGGAVVLLAAAVVLLIVFHKKKGVTKAED